MPFERYSGGILAAILFIKEQVSKSRGDCLAATKNREIGVCHDAINDDPTPCARTSHDVFILLSLIFALLKIY